MCEKKKIEKFKILENKTEELKIFGNKIINEIPNSKLKMTINPACHVPYLIW